MDNLKIYQICHHLITYFATLISPKKSQLDPIFRTELLYSYLFMFLYFMWSLSFMHSNPSSNAGACTSRHQWKAWSWIQRPWPINLSLSPISEYDDMCVLIYMHGSDLLLHSNHRPIIARFDSSRSLGGVYLMAGLTCHQSWSWIPPRHHPPSLHSHVLIHCPCSSFNHWFFPPPSFTILPSTLALLFHLN